MTSKSYILYIEDERPVFDLVREALKLSGHTVVGASSGREGLELMRQTKPDLLLLDLMMRDMNGWDVYKQMKTDDQLADIPVIVVTAKVPQNDRVIVDGLPPVDDYITKPFDVERLIRAVQNLT
ncbi:MAG: response regulator [Anaerolineaceae bacterium]|nr:response regulator [Anaerolineaceae bacterium]